MQKHPELSDAELGFALRRAPNEKTHESRQAAIPKWHKDRVSFFDRRAHRTIQASTQFHTEIHRILPGGIFDSEEHLAQPYYHLDLPIKGLAEAASLTWEVTESNGDLQASYMRLLAAVDGFVEAIT